MSEQGTQRKPGLGHSTNRVGRSSQWVASCGFNAAPEALHIHGVREMNPALFTMLAQAETGAEAGAAFLSYMQAMFGIDPEQQTAPGGTRPFRSSFLRLLQGWSFDSNGPEGAVLKGWVESRFGIAPCFHKEVLACMSCSAWQVYTSEKMQSGFHANAIWAQLDLLYEAAQWIAARFAFAGQTHLTLYRGSNALEDHAVLERIGKREAVIRLNNLVSFSSEREVADCFGDKILTVAVPVAKVLSYPGLLPTRLLQGEREFLAIGGAYRVRIDDV
ncbi:NAD(+)--dinitrogen-reductase ADP-D-ribosyltransferase [Rhodobacter sp. TJ_12]|uniref:NAD(+)--dinitrogen-reductase ADP-D-ribosyltransferase n=1 Tax=Rhodobacter sp. TJ_12 TaxID=2029399 RepID=UPI001CBE8F52|nr:NAD(+)--dinitrogen-reductase ADP-D-ribosyltransferase [Rhodobacter sp. TJ_12]MBZ4021167.1 NAD(+)--dinitrogen-reductase ADP-D-ribosyltransferase [Rhodobacter sp. TJ_12]